MDRRAFMAGTLGLLTAPLAAGAQPAGQIPRIGFLSPASPSSSIYAAGFEAFRRALRELGYVEGQSIVIEWRWADGRYDRLPDLAAELVRLKVDVIVTHGAGRAVAKRATATIPIVLALSFDPVAEGLVTSLARPGGNITGSSFMLSETSAKRLELLKEAVPRVTRVAVLFNPERPGMGPQLMEPAARALKMVLYPIGVRRWEELEGAFVTMADRGADALAVFEDVIISENARRVAKLAVRQRLPSAGFPEWPEAGGLMGYGVSTPPLFRRAASYVDKILRGAKPADLPIEQATEFKLSVNLKTAKALGLSIAPSVLARADELIQ
jgi:putative ABC transport system substrate-binding protein